MSRKFRKVVFIVCVITMSVTLAAAEDLKEKKYDFGLAVGPWLAGVVDFSYNIDFNKESTVLYRAFIDAYVVPKLAVGVYINYSGLSSGEVLNIKRFGTTYDIPQSGTRMFEFGGVIKPRFFISDKVALKPGLSFGYRKYSSDSDFVKSKALGINGSCEAQFQTSDKLILFAETGFMSQPDGGNDDTHMTFGLIPYLLFGVEF